MSLPSTTNSLEQVLVNILSLAQQTKAQASNALQTMQSQSISTTFVFRFLDQMGNILSAFTTFAATSGLNAYASANLPGYTGTLTTDINNVISAGNACINWVYTNFPRDNTSTWILCYQLNSDGSRSDRTFTSNQTAGLQSLLQTFIASIG